MEVIEGTSAAWTDGVRVTVPPERVLSTIGCSGAAGFFKCEVTHNADASVAPTVSAVAPALRMNTRTGQPAATGARRNGTWSNFAPRISPESAPRCPLKIS